MNIGNLKPNEQDHTPDQPTGGDGLGESTAPGPKTPARGERQELENA